MSRVFWENIYIPFVPLVFFVNRRCVTCKLLIRPAAYVLCANEAVCCLVHSVKVICCVLRCWKYDICLEVVERHICSIVEERVFSTCGSAVNPRKFRRLMAEVFLWVWYVLFLCKI